MKRMYYVVKLSWLVCSLLFVVNDANYYRNAEINK